MGTRIVTMGDDRDRARELLRDAAQLCASDCRLAAPIAEALAKAGDVHASKKLFVDAWNASLKSQDVVERRIILTGIVKLQTQAGQANDAIIAAEHLGDRHERALALAQIASAQAEVGQLNSALQTLNRMPKKEGVQRDIALTQISMTLAERRDFVDAIRVLDLIPSKVEAARCAQPGKMGAGDLRVEEPPAVDRATMIASGLVVVAQYQAEAADLKGALRTARQIGIESLRDAARRRITCAAADLGDLVSAKESRDVIKDQVQKDLASVCCVAAFAKQGRFKEASDLIESISPISEKAAGLLEIAVAYAGRGDLRSLQAVLQKATSLVPSNPDAKNAAGIRIVSALLQSAGIKAAESFVQQLDDPATRSKAFQTIAIANWQSGDKGDAIRMFRKSQQAVESVSDLYQKFKRLQELSVTQAGLGDKSGAAGTINVAVAAALKFGPSGGTDVIALVEIATSQVAIGDPNGAKIAFDLARTAVTRYPDESYRAQLLQCIVEAQARVDGVELAIQSARNQKLPLVRAQMLLGIAQGLLSRQSGKKGAGVK